MTDATTPEVGKAGYVHTVAIYQGACGHLWDRRREAECARCELEALFELQWKRWHEAVIPAWQAAHPGMELTWPDLGEALRWLLEARGLLAEWDGAWSERLPRGDEGRAIMLDLVARTDAYLGPDAPTRRG